MKITKISSKIKSFLVLVILSAALGACATIEGAGKDIESAGEVVQDAADG